MNTPWQNFAACRGLPAEMFFPYRTDEGGTERARVICRRCVVAEQCLTFANENDEQHGVWGGLSRSERRLLVNP